MHQHSQTITELLIGEGVVGGGGRLWDQKVEGKLMQHFRTMTELLIFEEWGGI